MNVTGIRLHLVARDERLLAFASVEFDSVFVVRDLKVIRGNHGIFLAMPDRMLTDRCPDCKAKNRVKARYCDECGVELNFTVNTEKVFSDIAHPITRDFRDELEEAVLDAYEEEVEHPGTIPPLFRMEEVA